MTKPYYKIWMSIEFIDEDYDVYEDVEDETIACGEHFNTLADAIRYRDSIVGTVIRKAEPMKISYIGPYPLVPAKDGDAGYDISSNENGKLYGSMSMGFSTGLYVAIPPGYVGKVVSRSGLAFKHNIEVGAGVIDSGYRGEVRILLHNFGDRPFEIKKGDRIAQLLILKHESPEFVLVDELDSTERGAGGFGHTGINNQYAGKLSPGSYVRSRKGIY